MLETIIIIYGFFCMGVGYFFGGLHQKKSTANKDKMKNTLSHYPYLCNHGGWCKEKAVINGRCERHNDLMVYGI